MNDERRLNLITAHAELGWVCDRDDDTHLGFTKDGWIRDYNKETGRFVHFNGEQKITLHPPREENDE